MIIYNILLNLLFVTLSFSRGLIFENLERGVIAGQENIQSYTNDFEGDGMMVLTLILANGKKYRLTEMLCHKEFGQFSWNPPADIPLGSSGRFYYDVDINGDLHSGEGGEMIFVEKYNTVSSSTTTPPSKPSEKTKEPVPAKTTTSVKNSSEPTSNPSDNKNSSSSGNSSSSSNVQNVDTADIEVIPTNDTIVTEDTTGTEPIIPAVTSDKPAQIAGVDSKQEDSGEKSNGKYLLYIGGGGGLVVVAIAGFLIANKFRSKKIDEYDIEDSKPFNSASPYNSNVNGKYPEMPNLLNGNLSPVNMYNSPKDTPINNNGFDLYNNEGNKNSYGMPNIGSPSFSPKNNNNYDNYNDDYRDNYRESYRGDYRDNYRDQKNSIINLNSNPNDDFNIDVRPTMPPKIDFVANPRCGSLPRNKLPNDFNPPMNDDNYKSYRNSVLSFISSNRGSYYGAAQAEHTVKHFLLNKVCTVAYVLEPENEDELYLTVGDKVKILEVFDDGWAYALQLDTGLEGMIPLNCTSEYYQ